MPIYEFRCEQCRREFETLVMGREEITCPDCDSATITRLLSTFSHKSGDHFVSSKGSGCGDCSSTSCGSGGCGCGHQH